VQTKTGVLLGTPDYMSPEQARGKDIDHRTDIYALGVLTFEILTGKRPFPKYETPLETLQAHAEKAPLSLGDEVPTLPQEIIQLAEAMLAKDPDHRPSLSAVRAVIKRLRSNTIIPTMSVASLEMSLPASLPASSATGFGAPSELSLTALRLGAEPVVPSAQSLVESLPSAPSVGLDALNSVPTAPGTIRASAEQSSAKWPTTVPGTAPGDLRPPSNPGVRPSSEPPVDRRQPSQPPYSTSNDDPRYMTQPPMSDPRRHPPDPISGPVIVDIRQGPPVAATPVTQGSNDPRHTSHPPGSQVLANAVADARFTSQPPPSRSMSQPPVDARHISQPPSTSSRFPSTVPGTITNRSPTNPPALASDSSAAGSQPPTAAGSHPPTSALRAAGSPHASTTFGVAPPFKVTTSKKQPVATPSSRVWIAAAVAVIAAAAAAVVLTQIL
jgi:serine/threonine protein kinase